ncbi:helix-turn-helix domain-containing protein [Pseudorhizobium endolithicum]|nr:helix-turn-helix domain-containing protein [Pseudorhizobium endolithicum]
MRFDEHVLAFRGETEVMAPGRRPVSDIVGEVLHAFPGFTIADLKSGRRQRDLCFARQTAMYVVRHERPDLSYPVIGRWFGGRDHTTVMSSVRKIAALRGEV